MQEVAGSSPAATTIGSPDLPRPGYKDKFPELMVRKYLVVDPYKIGKNYPEYTRLYCRIFKHC